MTDTEGDVKTPPAPAFRKNNTKDANNAKARRSLPELELAIARQTSRNPNNGDGHKISARRSEHAKTSAAYRKDMKKTKDAKAAAAKAGKAGARPRLELVGTVNPPTTNDDDRRTSRIPARRSAPSTGPAMGGAPSAAEQTATTTSRRCSTSEHTAESRPGAVRVRLGDGRRNNNNNTNEPSVPSFDPTVPLPDVVVGAAAPNVAEQTNTTVTSVAGTAPPADGDDAESTLLVAARVVSSTSLRRQQEVNEQSPIANDDTVLFVATAERDSAWQHFRRNRKLQWALAALLLVVVMLVVALSVVLSTNQQPLPEPGPGPTTDDGSDEAFWSSLQVPPAIDGDDLLGKFGASVSTNRDGTRMAVGSSGFSEDENDDTAAVDDGLVQRGLVSVYDLTDDDGWELIQNIQLTARDDARSLAESRVRNWKEMIVALSRDGRKLAVGTPFHDSSTRTNIGQVEVFTLDEGGKWKPLGAPMTGNENLDMFGASVSLSEDGGMMAVGSPGHGENSVGAANVYLFNRGTWELLGGRNIVGSSTGQRLGGSVSLSSDGFTLAAGSSATSDSTNTRVANVYKFKSGDWDEMGTGMKGGVGLFNTEYDVALSADGARIVISNHYTSSRAEENAADADEDNTDLLVQVFQFQSNDWTPLSDNLHAMSPGEKSGYFISLDDAGETILMGDPGRKVENGGNTGHAHLYVYDPDNGAFRQLGPHIDGEDAGDLSGFDVAISGDGQSLVSGAPTNRGGGVERGRVKVFIVPDQD